MASVIKLSNESLKEQGSLISGLQTVGVWNNQLDGLLTGAEDTVIPGIFFERLFDPAIQLLMGLKQSEFLLNVHILHDQIDAGDGNRNENSDVFDVRDDVLRKFTGFTPVGCSILQYANEQQDFNHNNIYHYIVSFKSSMIDITGTQWDDKDDKYIIKDPPVQLDLKANLKKPTP